ncbi:MAG: YkgJ family cysteine cluster protein [Desulfobacteraceae bacterium]|nr:MAG: YkgJ family cysteine cluster protein [Desulfobacteraceae bacterium]
MDQKISAQITACARCGVCCSKGGPALHDEDKDLVESGILPMASLYTIRKGELAHDNVVGGLIRLPSEIVKIKTRPGSPACMYFDETNKSCGNYDGRPIECRTLECWNTGAIESLYARSRLTRERVFANIPWLLELVITHEAECAIGIVQALVERRESADPDAGPRLSELVRYDLHYREILIQKGNLLSEMMDFLFGRPLADIISRQFKVKVVRTLPGESESV